MCALSKDLHVFVCAVVTASQTCTDETTWKINVMTSSFSQADPPHTIMWGIPDYDVTGAIRKCQT
jgi:hypothetical protein